MLKKIILSLIFVFTVNLNGCVYHHYETQPKKETPKQDTYQSKPKSKPQINKQVCELLYNTYKTCYGEGVKCSGDLNKCAETGAKLYQGIVTKMGGNNAKAAEILAIVCAMGCKSAGSNAGLPSYEEFEREVCNKVGQ